MCPALWFYSARHGICLLYGLHGPRCGAHPKEEAQASLSQGIPREPWVGEPEGLEDLVDRYIIEAKFSGRAPAATMYLVQSRGGMGPSPNAWRTRNSNCSCPLWFHKMIKLMAQYIRNALGLGCIKSLCTPSSPTTWFLRSLGLRCVMEFAIAHGPAKFLKTEKFAALKRQGETVFLSCFSPYVSIFFQFSACLSCELMLS